MDNAAEVNNAIIDLQTKLSFQDDLLEDLNQVVTDQQHHIMRLESALESLRVQVKTLQVDPTSGEATEPPPPHY
jgi:SlyX protein